MTEDKYARYLDVFADVASRAGKEIKIYQGRDNRLIFLPGSKIATEADALSNRLILTDLRHEFPRLPIVSEEGDISENPREKICTPKDALWDIVAVVDPLDGTDDFNKKKNGAANYCVAIGLLEKMACGRYQAVCGLAYFPETDLTYFASKDGHAYRKFNGKPRERINVSNRTLDQAVLLLRNNYNDAMAEGFRSYLGAREVKMPTSGGFKIIEIAQGNGDVYVNTRKSGPWDIAPFLPIIEAAGGRATDKNGNDLTFDLNQRTIDVWQAFYNKEDLRETLVRKINEYTSVSPPTNGHHSSPTH